MKTISKSAKQTRTKLRIFENSDESWREFGRTEPYYGVLSSEKFRAENLSQASLDEFFYSGEEHIEGMLRIAAKHVSDKITMGDALDFGCGVGRLMLPLARRFHTVTGVDISSHYIAEAKRNCESKGFSNVAFSESLSALGAAGRRFDFIHSCIVFNHIPWAKGQMIISEMFELLSPGGVMAIGLLHRRQISNVRRVVRKVRAFLPAHWFINLLQGHKIFEPLMQSNEYPLDELIPLLNRVGATGYYLKPHTNENNESWAVIFCMKDAT